MFTISLSIDLSKSEATRSNINHFLQFFFYIFRTVCLNEQICSNGVNTVKSRIKYRHIVSPHSKNEPKMWKNLTNIYFWLTATYRFLLFQIIMKYVIFFFFKQIKININYSLRTHHCETCTEQIKQQFQAAYTICLRFRIIFSSTQNYPVSSYLLHPFRTCFVLH